MVSNEALIGVEQLVEVTEAKRRIEDWRIDYDEHPTRRSLGEGTPSMLLRRAEAVKLTTGDHTVKHIADQQPKVSQSLAKEPSF